MTYDKYIRVGEADRMPPLSQEEIEKDVRKFLKEQGLYLNEHGVQVSKTPPPVTELEVLREVATWAQVVLTAWNVGSLEQESLLHKKLREVLIASRSFRAVTDSSSEPPKNANDDAPCQCQNMADGGLAFPAGYEESTNESRPGDVYPMYTGMSLRDYFAVRFAVAQIHYEGMEGCDKKNIVGMGYELADAMIAFRNQRRKT